MKIVFEIASEGQKVFYYTTFLYIHVGITCGHKKGNKLFSEKKGSSEKYIDIIWGQKKFNNSSSEKNSSEQNSSWRNIKNKILYSLKKLKEKGKLYFFLLKMNMISIRATEVNLVIKRNREIVINNSRRMKVLAISDRCVLPKKWRWVA